ncbi:MAG: hypothetical protein ABIR27_03915 [Dokdonella sp.]
MQRTAAALIGLGFSLVVSPTFAQSFLGRLGGSCVTLPANHQQMIVLNSGIAAGSTLVVTVAASSAFVSGLEIDDVKGNNYQALGGIAQNTAGSLVHFRSALQRGLGSGDVLMLSYESAGSALDSCVSILGYSGVPFGNVVQETLGSASGQSNAPSVTANTQGSGTRSLVLAAFSTSTNPGTVTPQSPAVALPTLCSGGSFCLIDAQYFDDPSSVESIGLTTANSTNWVAALTQLQADGIFGNGYD